MLEQLSRTGTASISGERNNKTEYWKWIKWKLHVRRFLSPCVCIWCQVRLACRCQFQQSCVSFSGVNEDGSRVELGPSALPSASKLPLGRSHLFTAPWCERAFQSSWHVVSPCFNVTVHSFPNSSVKKLRQPEATPPSPPRTKVNQDEGYAGD